MFRSCNLAYSQTIPITETELLKFAEHNLERKACLELNEINENQIDSLIQKNQLLHDQIDLKIANITDYQLIVKDLRDINVIRVVQIAEYIEQSELDRKTIKKQNRRLNFWRIFTPCVVTGVAVIALIK